MEVRVKLFHVRTGEPGRLVFEIDPLTTEAAKEFFRKKNEREKETEQPVWIDAVLKFWHEKRTNRQNRLYWRFVTPLAIHHEITKEEEHEILKDVFLEKMLVEKTKLMRKADEAGKQRWALVKYEELEAKSTTKLDTVEFGQYMEKVINLCAEAGLPVYESYLEWHGWLEQFGSPLDETYKSENDYRMRHPVCEFCGKDIRWEDGHYLSEPGGELLHIISKGAGGADKAWNRIHACYECHRCRQHQTDWGEMIEKFPHMEYRMKIAQEKSVA